jgi:rfaE bifunctional protein nucleotidyltransferase chain/domain
MKKILTIKEAFETAKKLKNKNKTIVLTGGFFDILHLGHIKFLEKAKECGNFLFVLLEEDKKAREKGKGRPINSQKIRAEILSALASVDYIVMLKDMTNDQAYDKILIGMHPNTISTTSGDPNIEKKQRQAKLINAKLVCVIEKINNTSTTKYIKFIDKN